MEIKKPLLPLLALALTVTGGFSTPLNASDLSYNFLEADILITDSDDDLERDSAFSTSASYRIIDQLFVFGGFSKSSASEKTYVRRVDRDVEFDIDVSGFGIGAGYIYPIKPNWDANVTLGYSKGKVDYDPDPKDFGVDLDEDIDSIDISGGVRAMYTPKIELSAFLEYSKFDDDSDTSVVMGGQYYILDNLSAGVVADIDSDGISLSARARFYF
jgi:hypothetical protein